MRLCCGRSEISPESLRYHSNTSGACKLILFVTRAAPSVIHRLRDEDDLLQVGSLETENVLCEVVQGAAAFLAYALV